MRAASRDRHDSRFVSPDDGSVDGGAMKVIELKREMDGRFDQLKEDMDLAPASSRTATPAGVLADGLPMHTA